jgi:hypothetical protein
MTDSDRVCKHCGESFGNAGAKARHEDNCPSNRGGSTTQTPEAQVVAVEGDTQQERRPQAQNGGQAPGAQIGAAMMEALGALNNPQSAEEQKQATHTLLELGKGAASTYIDQKQQQQERQRKRAENANLQPADQYPQCSNCSARFQHIPDTDYIKCENCGEVHEVVV